MRQAPWVLMLLMAAGCGEAPTPQPTGVPQTVADCVRLAPRYYGGGPIRQAYTEGWIRGCVRDMAAGDPNIVATECFGTGSDMICVTQ